MAMYGWIASKESAEDLVEDPQTALALKKFSYDSGAGPFKFEVGDVVDTKNMEGSSDHTVWIEIYDKNSGEKRGEISTELSDNTDGPVSSNSNVILATCLSKLGFMDESEGQGMPADFPENNGAPEPTPEDFQHVSSRIKAASNLLLAIHQAGIYVDPSFLPHTATVSDCLHALDRFIQGS
jgi:hypothetical protein